MQEDREALIGNDLISKSPVIQPIPHIPTLPEMLAAIDKINASIKETKERHAIELNKLKKTLGELKSGARKMVGRL